MCSVASCARLFVTPWTVANQAPLSMGFCRQEYWSGQPFPSPGDLPDPEIKPGSRVVPELQVDSLSPSHHGSPNYWRGDSFVAKSCLPLCNPMDCSLQGSSLQGIPQARILEWVSISLSRGIFLTQGSNPGLLHCRQILYHLSHQGGQFGCRLWVKGL